MPVSRRTFLASAGAAGATVAALQFPLAKNFAFAEPARGAAPDGSILLNSNENAYGTFASVHAAMASSLGACNRYPDAEHEALTERLAAYHKIHRDQVVLGAGSTDILRMAADAFSARPRVLITAAPTFEALAHYAARREAEVVQVPLRPDFAHDLDAILAKTKDKPGLVYICNPNNPTAGLTPRKEIEAFLGKLPKESWVVIDEAYHHFADSPDYVSFLERPVDDRRVIVARTFSKIYGLAGMRLGYAVAAPETIARMARFSVFDSPSGLAARAGLAALEDDAALQSGIRRNAADRTQFLRQASARNLRTVPSQANFVMVETGRPVREVIAYFRQNHIHIGRPFPPMNTYARISLGTPEQMAEFWKVWDQMPNAHAGQGHDGWPLPTLAQALR